MYPHHARKVAPAEVVVEEVAVTDLTIKNSEIKTATTADEIQVAAVAAAEIAVEVAAENNQTGKMVGPDMTATLTVAEIKEAKLAARVVADEAIIPAGIKTEWFT
tara:strand:- start:33 stop:347 length:315 start_codon:yes stop_codon:yes gene_type:complete